MRGKRGVGLKGKKKNFILQKRNFFRPFPKAQNWFIPILNLSVTKKKKNKTVAKEKRNEGRRLGERKTQREVRTTKFIWERNKSQWD